LANDLTSNGRAHRRIPAFERRARHSQSGEYLRGFLLNRLHFFKMTCVDLALT
jgi:hypothetical protein